MIEKSKELAFLLRHDTEYNWGEHGWRQVKDLIDNHEYTMDMLETIVDTDNKGRYEFNEDHTMIRARQGHSINVDVELQKTVPPKTLYHGTATRFIDKIRQEGIKKMTRNYVHLTSNLQTAKMTGERHGKPIIIVIDTYRMHLDGIDFYLARNNVWLTEYIDPKYFHIMDDSF